MAERIGSILKQWEFYAVLAFSIVMIVVGFLVYKVTAIPRYERISVKYFDNGSHIIVEEEQVMITDSGWNVVYRGFYDPIHVKPDSKSRIIILDIQCLNGNPYISTYNSEIYNSKKEKWGANIPFHVLLKIEDNEVGCWREKEYRKGEKVVLRVKYAFRGDYVKKNNFIHVLFSDEHPAISILEISGLKGHSEYRRIPGNIVIKIDMREGKLLRSTLLKCILFGDYAYWLLVFCLSPVPIVLWFKYGREREEIPKTPENEPPKDPSGRTVAYYEIDVILHGQITEKSIVAALSRLHLRGIIEDVKVEKKLLGGKKIIIFINTEKYEKMYNDLDPLERRLIDLIFEVGSIKETQGTVEVYELDPSSRRVYERFYREIKELFGSEIAEKIINAKGSLIMVALSLANFVTFLILGYLGAFRTATFAILYSIAGFLLSAYRGGALLGRYRRGYYAVYLASKRYERYLKKYGDSVLSADNLLDTLPYFIVFKLNKELEKLSVRHPERKVAQVIKDILMFTKRARPLYVIPVSFGGGGGGIGGGGGVGGGGGGGR